MTVGSGKRWWVVGVGLGLVVFALGVVLVKAGLEDADRWASVIGVFLNIVGLAVTVISAVQARRTPPGDGARVTNTIRRGEVDGPVLLGRDLHQVSLTGIPAPPAGTGPVIGAPSGDVENTVEDGRFHGPLIMGRDLRGVVLPPSGTQPGGHGTDR